MKKTTFVLFIVSLSLHLLMETAHASSLPSGLETGERARRDTLINYYVNAKGAWLDEVAAKLATGVNVDTALAHLSRLMDSPRGDMFWTYPFVGAYLYGRDRMPDSLKRKAREVWRTYTAYRGDTENHWVMYYTSLYLAAQTWPGEAGSQWYTGKSSEENLRDAAGWLNHWMKVTTTIGQGEFDSPAYMTFYLGPMFLLYQFAEDSVMKKKAEMMIDYILADFAVEYLKGNYCGGHSRDYPEPVVNPLSAPSTAWGYLFFGDAPFMPRGETLFAALSSYKLPEIIKKIATDRTKPYVETETKRVRNKMRHDTRRNPPVYKYTYMTSDYCVGSLDGGIRQPIQQHTWDVTWVSEKRHNTLFTIHPYYSGYELGSFFPEEEKLMVEAVVTSNKGTYDKEDKWTGSSPYESTFQHKNAIIVLYDIAPGTRHEHVDGLFPKSLDERTVDTTGWIFCRAGRVYIAYYPLQPYEWMEDSISYRLTSRNLKNGCVVEVSSEQESGTFDRFKEKIRQTKIENSLNKNVSVRYTTTGGDRMDFTFGGKRLLNGKPVDFKSYKLFHSPFLHAEVGSEKLKMMYKNTILTLDFKKVRIDTSEKENRTSTP